jgi:hypothetical protein
VVGVVVVVGLAGPSQPLFVLHHRAQREELRRGLGCGLAGAQWGAPLPRRAESRLRKELRAAHVLFTPLKYTIFNIIVEHNDSLRNYLPLSFLYI